MPDKPQTGMTEDQAIAALRARPPAARASLLAKMDPATKQRVLAKLSATGTAKADPKDLSVLDPDFKKKSAEAKHANTVDYMLDQLPTAVGTGASMLGGSKKLPTGLVAAGAGGVLGEDAREVLGKYLYNDPARKDAVSHMTAKETAEKLATAGAEQSGAELIGHGISGTVGKIAEKIGLKGAAESAVAADAGKGVQKTPGEVSGNRAQKFLEHFLNYMPGAMGPMGRFEEKRAGQTAEMVAKELDAIYARPADKEVTGKAVRSVIDKMQESATEEANLAYNPLKKPLGLAEDATRDQIEAAARRAAKPRAPNFEAGTPPWFQGDGGAALEKLKLADKAYAASREDIERNLVKNIAGSNRTEAVHQYVAKASLADLRAILPKLPAETRHAVARNVMEEAFNSGRDSVSKEFSAKAALKALDAIDKDGPKTALLFGKNAATVRAALKEIASIQHGSTPGGGMAGHRILTTILGAMAGAGLVSGHGLATMASVGGEMGASRILAEIVSNPKTSMNALMALRRVAASAARVGIPAIIDAARQESLPEIPTRSELTNASPIAQFMTQ